MRYLISVSEFHTMQTDDDIIIFDATFVLPTMNRNAAEEFEQNHIPNAQFFDIDAIADPDTDLPHMVPSPDAFATVMRQLGLCNHHKIVIYDNSPFLSAARAWWLLRLFGKKDVYVLDGGLNAYRASGGKMATGKAQALPRGDYTSGPALAELITFQALRHDIETGANIQIIDARPAGRFFGTTPEPRAGLRSGHMPNAINVPITDLLDTNKGTLIALDAVRSLFETAGLDFERPAITSCGSGVTAAGLTLALAELGKDDVALYDGSWAEWGASDAPIICDNAS